MTKKDYELIAGVLAEEWRTLRVYSGCLPADENHRDRIRVNQQLLDINVMMNLLTAAFRESDPKFNAEKFKTACGIQD